MNFLAKLRGPQGVSLAYLMSHHPVWSLENWSLLIAQFFLQNVSISFPSSAAYAIAYGTQQRSWIYLSPPGLENKKSGHKTALSFTEHYGILHVGNSRNLQISLQINVNKTSRRLVNSRSQKMYVQKQYVRFYGIMFHFSLISRILVCAWIMLYEWFHATSS